MNLDITDEQRARIESDKRELEQRRAAAGYSSIPENRRPIAPEVNCAACDHIGDFNDEHRRGYCMRLKQSVSTWHPVLCAAFVPLARDKRVKVVWKGIVYQA